MKWGVKRRLATACFLLGVHPLFAKQCEGTTFDFGFIASRMEDAHGNMRLRLLGPLYESTTSPGGDTFRAFRPFYSHAEKADGKKWVSEYLWPLGSSKLVQNAYSFRALTLMYTDFDALTPDSRYRLWVLPFWYQGRDKQGEEYKALWPIYGTIREFVTRDKITFALWPIYTKSEAGEQKTTSIVWPFYSRTTGGGMYRHRLFPLYGVSKQRNEFTRKFIFWPLWTESKYSFKSNQGSGWMLWPLYGQVKLKDQQIKWFLPPFFRVATGGKSIRSHALWPILQRSTGEIDTFYLWPLYGTKKVAHITSTFYGWPVGWRQTLDRAEEKVKLSYVLPFWYSNTIWPKKGEDVLAERPRSVYRKIWPLFSYRRERDVSRFRALALWPLKQSGPIERNWAPFWSFYQCDVVGEKSDTEFLWGLCRRTVRPDDYSATSFFPFLDWRTDHKGEGVRRSWSLFKGLVGVDYDGDVRSLQLLYFFRLGGKGGDE